MPCLPTIPNPSSPLILVRQFQVFHHSDVFRCHKVTEKNGKRKLRDNHPSNHRDGRCGSPYCCSKGNSVNVQQTIAAQIGGSWLLLGGRRMKKGCHFKAVKRPHHGSKPSINLNMCMNCWTDDNATAGMEGLPDCSPVPHCLTWIQCDKKIKQHACSIILLSAYSLPMA